MINAETFQEKYDFIPIKKGGGALEIRAEGKRGANNCRKNMYCRRQKFVNFYNFF